MFNRQTANQYYGITNFLYKRVLFIDEVMKQTV
jgi:hypothetical protein